MASITPRTIVSRTGDAVIVRTAQPADAEPLLAYIRAVAAETEFFVMEPDEFPTTDEQERQWIQDHLDRPGWLALVAETSGTIIAVLSFENGPHRRIVHRGTVGISIAQQWRGKGIGTAMLQALIEWAEASPVIEKLSLAVFANNETAIRLYGKLGFVEEGRHPREVKLGPGQYVDAVLMYRFVKWPCRRLGDSSPSLIQILPRPEATAVTAIIQQATAPSVRLRQASPPSTDDDNTR